MSRKHRQKVRDGDWDLDFSGPFDPVHSVEERCQLPIQNIPIIIDNNVWIDAGRKCRDLGVPITGANLLKTITCQYDFSADDLEPTVCNIYTTVLMPELLEELDRMIVRKMNLLIHQSGNSTEISADIRLLHKILKAIAEIPENILPRLQRTDFTGATVDEKVILHAAQHQSATTCAIIDTSDIILAIYAYFNNVGVLFDHSNSGYKKVIKPGNVKLVETSELQFNETKRILARLDRKLSQRDLRSMKREATGWMKDLKSGAASISLAFMRVLDKIKAIQICDCEKDVSTAKLADIQRKTWECVQFLFGRLILGTLTAKRCMLFTDVSRFRFCTGFNKIEWDGPFIAKEVRGACFVEINAREEVRKLVLTIVSSDGCLRITMRSQYDLAHPISVTVFAPFGEERFTPTLNMGNVVEYGKFTGDEGGHWLVRMPRPKVALVKRGVCSSNGRQNTTAELDQRDVAICLSTGQLDTAAELDVHIADTCNLASHQGCASKLEEQRVAGHRA